MLSHTDGKSSTRISKFKKKIKKNSLEEFLPPLDCVLGCLDVSNRKQGLPLGEFKRLSPGFIHPFSKSISIFGWLRLKFYTLRTFSAFIFLFCLFFFNAQSHP